MSAKKGVGASYTLGSTVPRDIVLGPLFGGCISRRFSSVLSVLLHNLESSYVFLNFNGNFITIETAQERSVERLSNAQARCQLWNLR